MILDAAPNRQKIYFIEVFNYQEDVFENGI